MNKELKQPWIDALRSGTYQQIEGKLKTQLGYCCLGVVCAIADINISEDGYDAIDEEGNERGYKPIEEKLFINNNEIETLWRMNDRENKTFPEIADWISENL